MKKHTIKIRFINRKRHFTAAFQYFSHQILLEQTLNIKQYRIKQII